MGAAYVFRRTSGAWDTGVKLASLGTKAYSKVGWSVAVSGDTALLGARAAETVYIASIEETQALTNFPSTSSPSTSSPTTSAPTLPIPAIIGIGAAAAGLLFGFYWKVCRRAAPSAAGDAYDLVF